MPRESLPQNLADISKGHLREGRRRRRRRKMMKMAMRMDTFRLKLDEMDRPGVMKVGLMVKGMKTVFIHMYEN